MPAKRCSGRREFFLSGRGPVASLSLSCGRRGGGILYFQPDLECAGRAKRRRRFGLLIRLTSIYPKRRRASTTPARLPRRGPRALAAALQTLSIAALTVIAMASCANRPVNTSTSDTTREVTDEAGRRVRLPQHIDRIVSLAPNLTEIVYAVGAGDRLVGDTEYCDYPAAAKNVAKIGDTIHPSIERIIALKPQLVLVSTASQLEAFTKQLDEQKIAVYVTNPRSLEEVFRSIATLGDLFGAQEPAATLVADLRRRTDAVEAKIKGTNPVAVFYQVSGEPLYTIGRESYLTDLVRRAGGGSVT